MATKHIIVKTTTIKVTVKDSSIFRIRQRSSEVYKVQIGGSVLSAGSSAIPPGGATGAVLTKSSPADYAMTWSMPVDWTNTTLNLYTTGTGEFGGDLTVGGDFEVTGQATIHDNLYVNGEAYINSGILYLGFGSIQYAAGEFSFGQPVSQVNVLPDQAGNAGLSLITDGTVATWQPTDFTEHLLRHDGELANIFINGFGEFSDETGWMTYDGTPDPTGTSFFYLAGDAPIGYGSFQTAMTGSYLRLHNKYRLDASRTYSLSCYARSNSAFDQTHRFAIVCYDVDDNVIDPQDVYIYGDSQTTLAQELENGDGTMYIMGSTSEWYQGSETHLKRFAFFDYDNDSGHAYPDYYYTKNQSGLDAWDALVSGMVSMPTGGWAGGTYPAGTAVANVMGGDAHEYPVRATPLSTDDGWIYYYGQFRPRNGTAYVRVEIQPNVSGAGILSIAGMTINEVAVPASTDADVGDVYGILETGEADWKPASFFSEMKFYDRYDVLQDTYTLAEDDGPGTISFTPLDDSISFVTSFVGGHVNVVIGAELTLSAVPEPLTLVEVLTLDRLAIAGPAMIVNNGSILMDADNTGGGTEGVYFRTNVGAGEEHIFGANDDLNFTGTNVFRDGEMVFGSWTPGDGVTEVNLRFKCYDGGGSLDRALTFDADSLLTWNGNFHIDGNLTVDGTYPGGGGGDVTGPAGATADDIATFDGITGKIIKDSAIPISDVVSNTSSRHSHANKTELDLVTDGDHDVIVTGNPHAVTQDDVGLNLVTNVATSDAPYDASAWNFANSAASKNAIRDKIVTMDADIDSNTAHSALVTGNPHAVTAADVGAIDDAPADGVLYARLDAAWQSVNDWLGGADPEKVAAIQFSLTATPTHNEGLLHWNSDEGTLEIGMPGGNVSLQIGQEFLVRVRNTSGSLIPNGSVIKNIGASGSKPLIDLASALSTEPTLQLGMTTEDIANNANGYVNLIGTVRGVDTSAYAEGTPLYLSITPGEFTDTKPSTPDHVVWIGVVTNQHATEGSVYFKPTNPLVMSDLSDVTDTAPTATNKHLVWDDANDYWEPDQISHHDLDGLLDTDDHPQYVEKNGWDIDYRSNVTLAFDDATRTFSMLPTGTDFSYWSNGVQYTKTNAHVTIDDVEGIWFIKFTDGTMVASQLVWDIATDNDALTAIVYWDATNKEAVGVGYELHSWAMDPATHAYKHHTTGALYSEGFLPGDLDIDGSGNDASAAQMSMENGTFYDEDIPLVCADGLPQEMAPILQAPIMYRDGANGDWRKVTATDYTVHPTGTGRAAYNEWTGTVWQVTEVGNLDFVLVHLIATNNLDDPVRSIMGQNSYSTIIQAREGANVEMSNLQLGALDLMTPEFIPIATFIVQTGNTYTNAVKSRFRATDTGDDFIDWRGGTANNTGGSGGLTSDHGALAGLGDDDHLQYHTDARGDLRYSLLSHSHVAADVTDFDTEVGNHTDVALNTTHRASDGKDHSDVVLNNAHRVLVTGNPHAVTQTEVGLSALYNTKQVRNMISSFATDFILGTPLTTHKFLMESSTGSMRYGMLGSLPVSTPVQAAIDAGAGASKTKRRTIYIKNPTLTDKYPICAANVACTITEVTALSDGFIGYNLEERAYNTPGTTGTNVFSSAKLAWSTFSTETSFSNDSLAAKAWLYYVCTSLSGSPTELWITVEWEED